MPSLIWTPASLADIQRLYRFLALKDIDAARRAVTAIRSGVKILAQRPELGRPCEDLDAEFREWLIDFGHGGYMVLYRLDGNTVTMLADRHQSEAGY